MLGELGLYLTNFGYLAEKNIDRDVHPLVGSELLNVEFSNTIPQASDPQKSAPWMSAPQAFLPQYSSHGDSFPNCSDRDYYIELRTFEGRTVTSQEQCRREKRRH